MTDDKAAIEQLYRDYWRCMIEKDTDGLRALIAEQCTDLGVMVYIVR